MALDIRGGHRVYHWKHGWIPLDHTAALSKAKGSHTLAQRYLNTSIAHGHTHPSFAGGGTGGSSHHPASAGFQPVAREHLLRRHRITVAYQPGKQDELIGRAKIMYGTGSAKHLEALRRFGGQGKFHLLDTSGHTTATISEDTARQLHDRQLRINFIDSTGTKLHVTDEAGNARWIHTNGSDIAPTPPKPTKPRIVFPENTTPEEREHLTKHLPTNWDEMGGSAKDTWVERQLADYRRTHAPANTKAEIPEQSTTPNVEAEGTRLRDNLTEANKRLAEAQDARREAMRAEIEAQKRGENVYELSQRTNAAMKAENEAIDARIKAMGALNDHPRKGGNTGAPIKPVSDALTVPSRGKASAANTALKLIATVHHDGALPNIPVEPERSKTANGRYHSLRSGQAVKITLGGDSPEHTAIHEIGHFIDHQGIGKPGEFASRAGGHLQMDAIMEALANTDAIKHLKSGAVQEAVDKSHGLYSRREASKHVNYLLTPHEQWARAYAQYITTKTQDPTLINQLDQRRGKPMFNSQWTDADFEPVMQAIDKLMEAQGWTTPTPATPTS